MKPVNRASAHVRKPTHFPQGVRRVIAHPTERHKARKHTNPTRKRGSLWIARPVSSPTGGAVAGRARELISRSIETLAGASG